MEDNSLHGRLIGSEIHGFGTLKDLDVENMMEEAKSRWLRPNEIHAMLANHEYFTIHVKPMNLPKSGTIVLFDRKKLRNFRKDGHNWKKKKDGKTVKEAHEHLKVGNEERIHVYYAHGEDNPTFVRRCYWLLDKSLEHIVLVHYRETQEGSPSLSSPAVSDPSASWPLSEESDSVDRVYYGDSMTLLERHDSMTIKNHEQRLHEINTLEWDQLLVADAPNQLSIQEAGVTTGFGLSNPYHMNSLKPSDKILSTSNVFEETVLSNFHPPVAGGQTISYNISSDLSNETFQNDDMLDLESTVCGSVPSSEAGLLQNQSIDGLQAQDSFGRWMAHMISDSPGSVDDPESSVLTGPQSLTSSSMVDDRRSSTIGQMFNITDISPTRALSSEETKILIVGFFNDTHLTGTEIKVFLACGDSILQTEVVQEGVFRAILPPQNPGLVNMYLTFDGKTPISQVLTFDFRAPTVVPSKTASFENWEEYQLQMRLARLLFSSTKILDILSSKISPNVHKQAKMFAQKTSHISQNWLYLTKMIMESKLHFSQAKESLFEVVLQNRLREWLLEKVLSGAKISERDEQGQGVIHLCAILGYTWVVPPFSCSGLSLDYRDKFGWTALHWAAYHGREKMVAALLSAGAKPNLVTDPTSDNPSGCNAADLASLSGHEGLSAYLAEKALVAQLDEMTIAGNVSGSLQSTVGEVVNPENFSEEESYLKDALAAYRTAADAAARIQTAFREHSLKVRTKEVESSNPEIEARNIVAAMKIQHAFRNYETKKKIAAAARIQYRFRTWKMRKDFVNMRRKAIKIQAAFRGFQMRKQYRKICWSVGILEKAVLRWRLKRKGLRGLQVQSDAAAAAAHEEPKNESDVEEDFFRASRKQAEERVERSVVRVQAMFRSRKAQEDYRRMKLEHNQAKLEFEGLFHPDKNMG